jgi:hypothetical protein
MKRTVKYDDNDEPTALTIGANRETGLIGHFQIDGDTAVLTYVERGSKHEGGEVYADNISHLLENAERLPVVTAAVLDDYEPPE